MNYFKQIYYEMRHQKMMTWVSVSGTALSIFLVMAFFMTEQVKTVEVSPDSNRQRVLFGINLHSTKIGTDEDWSTSGLSATTIDQLYKGLDGVELMSYVMSWGSTTDINQPSGDIYTLAENMVDGNFWKIYDFRFIDGRPFDMAESDSHAKLVVLTESTARKIFGETKVAGRNIEVEHEPYVVCGVVKDPSPMLTGVYAEFYRPWTINPNSGWGHLNLMANGAVRLLMKEGVDPEYIKEQVKRRYDAWNTRLKKDNIELVYHSQPYTAYEMSNKDFGSNNGPNTEKNKFYNILYYTVLLLLPAINLSSMTRTRLRRRVEEIGVRRAYGAKKIDIIRQMLGENLIITLAGGIIGLVLSLIFIMFLSHLFFTMGDSFNSSVETISATPDWRMLFRWQTFLVAFGLCFILNILSTTIPAWKASRVNPAEALSGKN